MIPNKTLNVRCNNQTWVVERSEEELAREMEKIRHLGVFDVRGYRRNRQRTGAATDKNICNSLIAISICLLSLYL